MSERKRGEGRRAVSGQPYATAIWLSRYPAHYAYNAAYPAHYAYNAVYPACSAYAYAAYLQY